jgi:hypothetical protein
MYVRTYICMYVCMEHDYFLLEIDLMFLMCASKLSYVGIRVNGYVFCML